MGTTRENSGSASVRPMYQQLLAENRRLKQKLRAVRQRLQAAEKEIEQLTGLVEKLRREGKRQAAPFRKQEQAAAKPKKPGRKKGRRHGRHAHRSLPPRIDESYDVPLPPGCPHCGGDHVSESHVDAQYQTEIPRTVSYRKFDVHVGTCDDCGRTVQGRHDLQTSTARGAAASQLGPNVHAMLALLNKQFGLSHGKSVKLLGTLFEELYISRATSARSIARTAGRCGPAYQQIRQDVRNAAEVAPDETGWRVAGRSAWLHAFASNRATCYVIDPTRSHQPAEALLGLDWSGTLVHDGWSVYDRFTKAFHQQCLAHLKRRCQDLSATAVGGAVRFPRTVLSLIDRAYALRRAWRGHRFDKDELAVQGLSLSCELESLAAGRITHAANRRLAKHILKHPVQWFWFLIDPSIASTNYRAEQAIRPAVVNRKVWGGNRTWRGAQAQSILTSIIRTAEQRTQDIFQFLLATRCRPDPQLLTE
jgi:transposase